MKYLITGHTGFIGSWMTLFLLEKGEEVSGFSLPKNLEPIKDGIYSKADISSKIQENGGLDIRGDIRNYNDIKNAINEAKPDVIIHLCAQRLVSEGYSNPVLTYETNTMGTLNLFEAVKDLSNENDKWPLIFVASTDKVYRNNEGEKMPEKGFVETSQIGAQDPMSTSKTFADLLAQSYTYQPDFKSKVIVGRTANIIGGGDTAKNVLFNDIVSSIKKGEKPELRMPSAIRPWQHVLDCVSGYFEFIKYALTMDSELEILNIGASEEELTSVGEMTSMSIQNWDKNMDSSFEFKKADFKEEGMLAVNSDKAYELLGWKNKFSVEKISQKTIEWEKRVFEGEDAYKVSLDIIKQFNSI